MREAVMDVRMRAARERDAMVVGMGMGKARDVQKRRADRTNGRGSIGHAGKADGNAENCAMLQFYRSIQSRHL